MKSHLIMFKIESRDLLRKRTFIEENMSENVKYLCGYFLKMSSNFNSSYMTISSLTYIPGFFCVKYFIQLINTDYANQTYFENKITFRFSLLKTLNQIKPSLAGTVLLKVCSTARPSFKMTAVTTNRNFFNCILLLYYKSK